MSTTFGVLKPNVALDKFNEDELIPIAHRWGKAGGGVNVNWLNDLAPLLSDETKVYPLDNTSQGVETIGDLRKLVDQM